MSIFGFRRISFLR